MERDAWNYLVLLRRDLLAAISGIENANNYLWFDNTSSNFTTRRLLERVLQKAAYEASAFGLYVVTRHLDCGRPGHRKASDLNDYVWADPYGLGVEWQDHRFVWGGDQLFQGTRFERCPCSKSDQPVSHPIIQDIIYGPEATGSLCPTIFSILSDIQSAIEAAEDKKPRSGIREHLLRAILLLNDAIMPTAVDAYIAAEVPNLLA